MQESKENEFGNFSKMLRKLQIDNVGLPELRQLKQEHAYLEKLRQQRTKIEELKAKYDSVEAQLNSYQDHNQEQQRLIEEQHRTIQVLQEKLADFQRKKQHLQSGVAKAVEAEREKQRYKTNELLSELEEVKKESKAKDMIIFELEDDIQRLKTQYKDQIQIDRKKIVAECEEKWRAAVADKVTREQEIEELRELVTRQHKALQLQNQQYEEAAKKNDQFSDALAELEGQLEQALSQKAEAEERVADLTELAGRMEAELQQHRTGASAKNQVQELRKRVNDLAKGELQRIQFIVNQFE